MQFVLATPTMVTCAKLVAWVLRRRRLLAGVIVIVGLQLGIRSKSAGQDTLVSTPVPLRESHEDQKHADLLDDFDGVRTSMQIIKSRSLAKVQRHHRSDQSPYRGRRSEFISVIGARGGERILAAKDIEPVAAIPELEFAVWVRGNRVGFQMMARVRLPRSLDDAGEPLSIYVFGDRYSSPNNWQHLTVSGFEEQISNQVRAMRVDAGSYVDATEAFVDQVAINVYGGAKHNVLSVDDFTAHAAVNVSRKEKKPPAIHLANYQTQLSLPLPKQKAPDPNWIPQGAKHQGEAFAELQRLGFNTIWLPEPASPEQQKEADNLKLKLIGPTDLNGPQSNWADTSGNARWLSLRNKLRTAVFAGHRGFVFDPEPFAGLDESYAKAVAQLFNLELSILRPWILRYETNEPLRPTIRHPDFEVHGMASRHAGLIWVNAKPMASLQARNGPSNDIAMDLADAQYRDVYHMEPGSLEPARDRRIPGGVRITLNHDKPDGLLLMSSHPQILQAHKEHLQRIEKQYNKLLVTVIRHEMLQLDRQLETSIPDPKLVGHLRNELHALRGRITPVLESRERLVTYRQLDHVLGQLERVQHFTSGGF